MVKKSVKKIVSKIKLYDDSKEEMNKKVHDVIYELYELRKLETNDKTMKTKIKSANKHILSIIDKLLKYNDYLLYRPLWEELHDRMVYYYNFINEQNLKSKIPFFQTTLHNETVYWWKKAQDKNKLKGVLIHFDSHPDSNIPPHTAKRIFKKNKVTVNNFFRYSICGEIGSPVTCLMLMKASNNVIWATPPWLYDENGEYDQYLVVCKNNKTIKKYEKDEMTYLRSDKSPKDPWGTYENNDILRVPDTIIKPDNFSFFHKFKYSRLHLDKVSEWKDFNRISGKDNKFILDIDLDFFVCNGAKITKKQYMKDFQDVRSFYRVTGLPQIYTPRNQYDTSQGNKLKRALDKEIKEIKGRIDRFLKGLAYMKKQGKTPSVINLSDSTPSLFSGDINRAVFNNNYTPKYFIPYIHLVLIKGLHKLYGNSFMSLFN